MLNFQSQTLSIQPNKAAATSEDSVSLQAIEIHTPARCGSALNTRNYEFVWINKSCSWKGRLGENERNQLFKKFWDGMSHTSFSCSFSLVGHSSKIYPIFPDMKQFLLPKWPTQGSSRVSAGPPLPATYSWSSVGPTEKGKVGGVTAPHLGRSSPFSVGPVLQSLSSSKTAPSSSSSTSSSSSSSSSSALSSSSSATFYKENSGRSHENKCWTKNNVGKNILDNSPFCYY